MTQATGVERAGYQLRRDIEPLVTDPADVLRVLDAARRYARALVRALANDALDRLESPGPKEQEA